MATERVGILGSGDVGRALAAGFAGRGWDVQVGTRSPEKLEEWAEEVRASGADGTVAVGSFADAAAHGDVAVLAVRGEVAEDVVELAGPEHFAGTVVLDATNPLDFSVSPPGLLYGGTESLGERVQAALPDAHVVKCFSTVSNTQMVDPEFEAGTPPMLICGDDDAAKERAETILVEFGWPGALAVGDVTASRYLEALVPLWVRVGADLGTYEHAFAVVQ